jgi:hypothetical protein
MKQWLRDHHILYKELASLMGQSVASVCRKVNGTVSWQQNDLIFLHDHYGLSADFVLGLSKEDENKQLLRA